MQVPPKERRVFTQVAQSESVYAWAVVASNSGRFSDIVASNGREWALWEFHLRGGAPEVETVVFRVVEEFQRVLQGVVV